MRMAKTGRCALTIIVAAVFILALAPAGRAAGITIDHTYATTVSLSADAISSAAALRIAVRRASVGGYISGALDTLQGLDAKYSRAHWDFLDRGNPGWSAKIADFVDFAANNAGSYDVLTMKFCYIDPDADFATYRDALETLETSFTAKRIVWWTIPLETAANANRAAFNNQVRAYCAAHGKTLFDIADIECHDPAGNKLTDGSGYEILDSDYTTDGGHPDQSAGSARLAIAFWNLAGYLATGSATPVELAAFRVD